MNRKKLITVLLCLIFALALAGAVYAAVSYGSKEDPLITKSYLDKVLGPEIEAEMESEIEAAIRELENSPTGADFVPLTLAEGDKISCQTGCEVLHRSGELVSEGSFADTTTGAELPSGGTAEPNHLYMALDEANFIAATDVTVLIKGSYKLN